MSDIEKSGGGSLSMTSSASWTLDMPMDDRPWSEMWSLVQHNLGRLEEDYAQPRTNSSMDIKCDLQNFAISSHHLREHIKFDPALPPGVGNRVAGRAANSSAIVAAGQFADTAKHYRRKNGKKQYVTARIVRLHSSPAADVVWDDPIRGVQTQKDALAFAREVADAWRKLLTAENLIAAT